MTVITLSIAPPVWVSCGRVDIVIYKRRSIYRPITLSMSRDTILLLVILALSVANLVLYVL